MTFWGTIKQDARHHLCGAYYHAPLPFTPVRILRLLIEPEFRFVLSIRIYQTLKKRGFGNLAYLLYLRNKSVSGCDISMDATIGPGLRVTHRSDIIIGPQAVLGEDVVLFNGITIGNRLGRDSWEGMPRLGNRVLIGTGAKLLGSIEIGDDAKIGANAVVLKSVPAGATAVGNPAKILERAFETRP